MIKITRSLRRSDIEIRIPSSVNGYSPSYVEIYQVKTKIHIKMVVFDIIEDRERVIYDKSKEVDETCNKLSIVGCGDFLFKLYVKLNFHIYAVSIHNMKMSYLTIDSYHMKTLDFLRCTTYNVDIQSVKLKNLHLFATEEINSIMLLKSTNTVIYNQYTNAPTQIIGTQCKQFSGSEETDIINDSLIIRNSLAPIHKLTSTAINYAILMNI